MGSAKNTMNVVLSNVSFSGKMKNIDEFLGFYALRVGERNVVSSPRY
ncbi:hypothetical protein L195_g046973, partial [Trifolium pratense]